MKTAVVQTMSPRTAGWVAPGFEEVLHRTRRDRLTAPPEVARPMDEVMGVPSWYSLGYLRPGPDLFDDPREKPLRDLVHRAIERLAR